MSTQNYSDDDIKVLTDIEHVRLRTSVYLGSTQKTTYEIPIFEKNDIKIKSKSFIPALYKGLNEIIDNGLDELTQLSKTDKKLSLSHDTVINDFTVCDNGRGVPIGIHSQTGKHTAETVFTELRSGRNFNDDAKESGVIGTNGVGSSCTNFISEKFKIKIKRDNKIYEQAYLDGCTTINSPEIKDLKSKETGTCINFKFDTNLKQFEDTTLDAELIHNRVMEIALNNPAVEFSYARKQLDENDDVEQISETYHFKNGLSEYIKHVSDQFYTFEIDEPDFSAKYHIILDKYQGFDEKIFVYVNSSLLFEGGTASNMFFNSFFSSVQDQLSKEAKKRKLELNKNDIKQNLLIIAEVKMKNPNYDNQSKTRLISPEIKKYIDRMVINHIKKFITANKPWVEDILGRAEFRQRIADLAEVKKDQKKRKKGKLEKLIDCYGSDRTLCSISFSEGDCVASDTPIITADGTKLISDVTTDDKVLTHKGDYKKIVANIEVDKEAWEIKSALGNIIFSDGHKHPVYNTETEKIEIIKTCDLNKNIHKLLKRKITV